MPLFARRGKNYVCSVQCGAGRDAFIEVEFAGALVEEVELFELPPARFGLSKGVDPLLILEAARDGCTAASNEFGSTFYLKRVGYVPNDSRHYDLHSRCVWEIIRHLVKGGEFRELDEAS